MASAQCSRSIKLETPQIAVKASATAMHDFMSARTYEVAKSSPDKVEKVELLQGAWGKPDSVICWHYFVDGAKEYSKEIITDVKDYGNYKYTCYKQIEGHYVNQYKSFKWNLYVTPKDEGSLVRWSLEYEKENETDEDPKSMIDFCIEFTKEADAYLAKKQ